MADSVALADLPAEVQAQVVAQTGPIRTIESIAAGRNSVLSVRVHTERGQWFVKGLPATDATVATQEREYAISRHLRGTGPVARWRVRAGGWYLVAFDCISGRHANYQPGSPDLHLVADLLHRLSTIRVPSGVPLRRAEQRLADCTACPDVAAQFAGEHLVHSDPNPGNIIVAERAFLVDWGWATRGAAWLDAAYWIIWLIAAGHTPNSAEATAAWVPAYRTAPPDVVTAFAEANANLWAGIAATSTDPWRQQVQASAAAWASHRLETNRTNVPVGARAGCRRGDAARRAGGGLQRSAGPGWLGP